MVMLLMLVPVAGLAASGDDFYQRLYLRGLAHFTAGEYAPAFAELRNAAFGFVEQVEKFETAQAYAAIAAHRLQRDHDARDSLMRIVTAEKVQQHFRNVKLPDDLRAEVDTIAASLLTTEEATLLGVPAKLLDASAKPPVVVPTPTRKPPVATTAPRESRNRDRYLDAAPPDDTKKPVTPVPQPVTPAPQPVAPVPQPVVPAPQPVAPAPQPQKQMPQPVAPAPQPRKQTPQPVVLAPQPQPVMPAPQPVVKAPPRVVPMPQPAQPPAPAPQPSGNAETSLAEAQRAVDSGDIDRARSIYNTLLSGPALPHATALELADGLYRARDFGAAARAFQRASPLARGEERYHYYYAVALYESGRYRDAKRELAAALPHIEMTPDVARYRAKIEGAIE